MERKLIEKKTTFVAKNKKIRRPVRQAKLLPPGVKPLRDQSAAMKKSFADDSDSYVAGGVKASSSPHPAS